MMKTPARTTLPNNPRERQVHILKRSIIYGCILSCLVVYLTFTTCRGWWVFCFNPPLEYVIKEEMLAELVMSSIGYILLLASAITVGDIYFYERYVEIRCLLPFMKRKVIYYDMMHVHIMERPGFVALNHYETPPKFWNTPYTWLKTYYSDSIYFYFVRTTPPETWLPPGFSLLLLESNPETLEFAKTKAQSVSYR